MNTIEDLVRSVMTHHAISRRTLNTPVSEDWDAFAVIFDFEDDFDSVALSGYVYLDQAFVGFIEPTEFQLAEMARSYRTARPGPAGELPVSMVVQFDRTSGRYNVEYEYSNPERWADIGRMVEVADELRPNLR